MSMLSGSPEPEEKPRKSGLASILPYTTVLTIIVILYVAYVMYSRWSANKQAEEDARQKAAQAEQQRNAEITQHGELTFTTFYASKGMLHRGETARLCYGVMNAASLKLDPPIEQVQPTERHCIDIAPKKTTTYTLTADDGAGHTKTVSLTVNVR